MRVRTRIFDAGEAPTVRRVGERSARAGGERLERGGGAGPTRGPTATIPRTRTDAPVVLGRYRLRRRLGTGAFATVWLAHDERLDRPVAVKILPRDRVQGGRFEREARAAARLAHPGIVTLYEAAVDDEGAYLVSELVHGATLERLLADGRLSDRDVLQVGVALCDALAHAHAQGVIHRDVKPSNVLIPERPTTAAQLARLTDFGVARVTGADTLTRTGDVIGTAAYMAPEQAQGLPAGVHADLFSLALVLYEALSGVNPLRAAVSLRRGGAHLPPLRRQRRDLPRELGRAIDLALRPRPGERGTIDELRLALVASLDQVDDEPGVVADPWPARTLTREPETLQASFEEPIVEPYDDPEDEGAPPRGRRASRAAWPRRAVAGAATAALSAWLVRRAPDAFPIPPPLAACVAGVLVSVVPRLGWLLLTVVVAAALAIHSQADPGLALLMAALVPIVLSPGHGSAWPLAGLAPVLAALSLASAWPAIAGQARRAHRRAALGATGALWTCLWAQGLTRPVLTAGMLALAGAWAVAALVLPLTRSPRWPAVETLRLALWAVGLTVATAAAARLGGPMPHGVGALGAGVGALVALVTSRLRTRLRGHQVREGRDPTS